MQYEIILDLGDPEVIKAINGLYIVRIIVADDRIINI